MKLCEVCGSPEHPDWKAHTFVNTKSESVNTEKVVVNTPKISVNKDRHSVGYMKSYMALRRALKAGKASRWPRA